MKNFILSAEIAQHLKKDIEALRDTKVDHSRVARGSTHAAAPYSPRRGGSKKEKNTSRNIRRTAVGFTNIQALEQKIHTNDAH